MERQPGIWRIRSHAVARQVLTARGATSQAGFTSEHVPTGFLKHHPILFSDGPQHDEQRRKVGRYFAPAVVRERYGQVMDDAADALVTDAVGRGRCRVDEIALLYSVEVTRQVVGLTESSIEGLAGRLVKFFNQPPFDITQPDLGRTRRQWAMAAVNGLGPIARFHLADVRPAIRARRRERRTDVISHLLDEGYTTADILVECLTYGTAGMVTTREFIAMALWHLTSDPTLLRRYLGGDQSQRLALLEEVIRLEPVVGHLYRRVQQPLEVADAGQTWRFAPGDLLDLDVGSANLDPAAVGPEPGQLCPGRTMARGVHAAGLSFSDGAHRCPGQPLAMLETDVLLQRLLVEQPVVLSEPRVEWDDLVAGYCLRGFEVGFDVTAPPV
ncbi:cytochrome P450 [Aestuariimicrobium sp. Y1814]|uniref:cytochrome P450 n=1 Tax=Aestuariimicrobium sp. Y1814 TaxID=3418742 RepID=UPI003DA75F9C